MIKTILSVLEYAIYKYKTTGRQVHIQAQELMEQYNYFETLIPKWWEKISIREK